MPEKHRASGDRLWCDNREQGCKRGGHGVEIAVKGR